MRFPISSLIFSAFLASFCAVGATSTNAATDGIKVDIVQIHVFESENRSTWEMRIQNTTSNAILISRFSFWSVPRYVKLTDEAGVGWRVRRSELISDPPSTDVDYSLAVPGNTTVSVTVRTDGIERPRPMQAKKDTSSKPDKFSYEVQNMVSAMDQKSKKFIRLDCHGKGKAEVIWNQRPPAK